MAEEPGSASLIRRHADVQAAVSHVLAHARDVEDAFEELLPAVATALEWDYAGIWRVNEAGTRIACRHVWYGPGIGLAEFAQASRALSFGPGEGLPGRVWASAAAEWLEDVSGPRFPRVEAARRAGLRGGLAFPVRDSQVRAVIECFTRAAEGADPVLLRLVEAIGHQIGQFFYRRAAEARVEENEARYRAIVRGALDAIIAIDADGVVTEFNPAAERLFGYTRDEAVGQEMAALIIPPSFREAHRAGLTRQRETGESHILERRLELAACNKANAEFPVELTITRLPLAGGRPAFIGFVRDITERQQHEREREALLAGEREARGEAVEANRLKDEFLTALSHEMRTPLNAVLGWAHLLLSGRLADDRRGEALRAILRNAEAQAKLVNDLLDMSAFVTGQARLDLAPVDLAQVVDAAVQTVRPSLDARRLDLAVAVAPAVVHGDRLRLQQVFWNLLANAVKFTPAGGSVTVTGGPAGERAVVAVTDTGSGIDAALLPFVFDRFRQGSTSPAAGGGVGLGLAIVRHLVEAHGGEVQAASAGPGQGASFTVSLPLAADAGAPDRPPAAP